VGAGVSGRLLFLDVVCWRRGGVGEACENNTG
jgi:hypothetical protein